MGAIVDISDWTKSLRSSDADIANLESEDVKPLVAELKEDDPYQDHDTYIMAFPTEDSGKITLEDVDYMVYANDTNDYAEDDSELINDNDEAKDLEGVKDVAYDGYVEEFTVDPNARFERLGINVADPAASIHAKTDATFPVWADDFTFYVGDANGDIIVEIEGNSIKSRVPVKISADPTCIDLTAGGGASIGSDDDATAPTMPGDKFDTCSLVTQSIGGVGIYDFYYGGAETVPVS